MWFIGLTGDGAIAIAIARLDCLCCHPVFVAAEEEEEQSAQDHEEADHDGQDPVGHVHHVSSLGGRVFVLLYFDNLTVLV